jgi:hypothetical protein
MRRAVDRLVLEQAGQSYRGGPVDLELQPELHLLCLNPLENE